MLLYRCPKNSGIVSALAFSVYFLILLAMIPKFKMGPNTSPGAAQREEAPASQPYCGPAIYIPPPRELDPCARAVIHGPMDLPPTNQSSEFFTFFAAQSPTTMITAMYRMSMMGTMRGMSKPSACSNVLLVICLFLLVCDPLCYSLQSPLANVTVAITATEIVPMIRTPVLTGKSKNQDNVFIYLISSI